MASDKPLSRETAGSWQTRECLKGTEAFGCKITLDIKHLTSFYFLGGESVWNTSHMYVHPSVGVFCKYHVAVFRPTTNFPTLLRPSMRGATRHVSLTPGWSGWRESGAAHSAWASSAKHNLKVGNLRVIRCPRLPAKRYMCLLTQQEMHWWYSRRPTWTPVGPAVTSRFILPHQLPGRLACAVKMLAVPQCPHSAAEAWAPMGSARSRRMAGFLHDC